MVDRMEPPGMKAYQKRYGQKHKWYEDPKLNERTYCMVRCEYDSKIVRIPEKNFVVVKAAEMSKEEKERIKRIATEIEERKKKEAEDKAVADAMKSQFEVVAHAGEVDMAERERVAKDRAEAA